MGDRIDNLTIDGKKLIKELKVLELKAELERRGLSKYGNKKELLQRLSIFEENRQKSLSGQPSREAPNQWLENEADLNNDFLREYFRSQKALFQEHAQRHTEIGVGEAPNVALGKEQFQSNDEFALSTSHRETFSPPKIAPTSPSKRKKKKKKTSSDDEQVTFTPPLYEPSLATSRPSRSSAQTSRALNVASFDDEDSESAEVDPYVFDIKEKKKGHKKHHRIPTLKLHSPTVDSVSPQKSLRILSSYSGEEKVPSLKIKLPEPVPKISTSIISPTKDSINHKLKISKDESELCKTTSVFKKTPKVCLSPQNAEVSSSVEEIVTDSLVKSLPDSCADSTSNEGNGSSDNGKCISSAEDKVASPEVRNTNTSKTPHTLNLKISSKKLCHLGSQQWYSENSIQKESLLLTPSTKNLISSVVPGKETGSSIDLDLKTPTSHIQSDGVKPTVRKRGRPRLTPILAITPSPQAQSESLEEKVPCSVPPSKVVSKNEQIVQSVPSKPCTHAVLPFEEVTKSEQILQSGSFKSTSTAIPCKVVTKNEQILQSGSFKPCASSVIPCKVVTKNEQILQSGSLKPCASAVSPCKVISKNDQFIKKLEDQKLACSQQSIENQIKEDLINLRLKELDIKESKLKQLSVSYNTKTPTVASNSPSIAKKVDESIRRSSRLYKPLPAETVKKKNEFCSPLLKSSKLISTSKQSTNKIFPEKTSAENLRTPSSEQPDYFESLKQQIEMPLYVEKFPSDKSEVSSSTSELTETIKPIPKIAGVPCNFQPFTHDTPILDAHMVVEGHTSHTSTVNSDDRNIGSSLMVSTLPKPKPVKPILESTGTPVVKKSGYMIENLIVKPNEKESMKETYTAVASTCEISLLKVANSSKKETFLPVNEKCSIETEKAVVTDSIDDKHNLKDILPIKSNNQKCETEIVKQPSEILFTKHSFTVGKEEIGATGGSLPLREKFDFEKEKKPEYSSFSNDIVKKQLKESSVLLDDNSASLPIDKTDERFELTTLTDASSSSVHGSLVEIKPSNGINEQDQTSVSDTNKKLQVCSLEGYVQQKIIHDYSTSVSVIKKLCESALPSATTLHDLKMQKQTKRKTDIEIKNDKVGNQSLSVIKLIDTSSSLENADISSGTMKELDKSVLTSRVNLNSDLDSNCKPSISNVNAETKEIIEAEETGALLRSPSVVLPSATNIESETQIPKGDSDITSFKDILMEAALAADIDSDDLTESLCPTAAEAVLNIAKGRKGTHDGSSLDRRSSLDFPENLIEVKFPDAVTGAGGCLSHSKKHDFIEKLSANVYNVKKDSSKGLMEIIFDLDKRAKQTSEVEEKEQSLDFDDKCPSLPTKLNSAEVRQDISLGLSSEKVQLGLKDEIHSKSNANMESFLLCKDSSEQPTDDKFMSRSLISSPVAEDSPNKTTSVSEEEVNFFREVMELVPELGKKKPCFDPLLKLKDSQDVSTDHTCSKTKEQLIENRPKSITSLDTLVSDSRSCASSLKVIKAVPNDEDKADSELEKPSCFVKKQITKSNSELPSSEEGVIESLSEIAELNKQKTKSEITDVNKQEAKSEITGLEKQKAKSEITEIYKQKAKLDINELDKQKAKSEISELDKQKAKSEIIELDKQKTKSEITELNKQGDKSEFTELGKQKTKSEITKLDKQKTKSEITELNNEKAKLEFTELDKQKAKSKITELNKQKAKSEITEIYKQKAKLEITELDKQKAKSKISVLDKQKTKSEIIELDKQKTKSEITELNKQGAKSEFTELGKQKAKSKITELNKQKTKVVMTEGNKQKAKGEISELKKQEAKSSFENIIRLSCIENFAVEKFNSQTNAESNIGVETEDCSWPVVFKTEGDMVTSISVVGMTNTFGKNSNSVEEKEEKLVINEKLDVATVTTDKYEIKSHKIYAMKIDNEYITSSANPSVFNKMLEYSADTCVSLSVEKMANQSEIKFDGIDIPAIKVDKFLASDANDKAVCNKEKSNVCFSSIPLASTKIVEEVQISNTNKSSTKESIYTDIGKNTLIETLQDLSVELLQQPETSIVYSHSEVLKDLVDSKKQQKIPNTEIISDFKGNEVITEMRDKVNLEVEKQFKQSDFFPNMPIKHDTELTLKSSVEISSCHTIPCESISVFKELLNIPLKAELQTEALNSSSNECIELKQVVPKLSSLAKVQIDLDENISVCQFSSSDRLMENLKIVPSGVETKGPIDCKTFSTSDTLQQLMAEKPAQPVTSSFARKENFQSKHITPKELIRKEATGSVLEDETYPQYYVGIDTFLSEKGNSKEKIGTCSTTFSNFSFQAHQKKTKIASNVFDSSTSSLSENLKTCNPSPENITLVNELSSTLDDSLSLYGSKMASECQIEKVFYNLQSGIAKLDDPTQISVQVPAVSDFKHHVESKIKDETLISTTSVVDNFDKYTCNNKQELITTQQIDESKHVHGGLSEEDQLPDCFSASHTQVPNTRNKIELTKFTPDEAETPQINELKISSDSTKLESPTNDPNIVCAEHNVEKYVDRNSQTCQNQKPLIISQDDPSEISQICELNKGSCSNLAKQMLINQTEGSNKTCTKEIFFTEKPFKDLTRQKIEIPFIRSFQDNSMKKVIEKIKVNKVENFHPHQYFDTGKGAEKSKFKDKRKSFDQKIVEAKITGETNEFSQSYDSKKADIECSVKNYTQHWNMKQKECNDTVLPKEGISPMKLGSLSECGKINIGECKEFPILFDISSIPLPPVIIQDNEEHNTSVVSIVKGSSLCDSNDGNFVADKMARKNKNSETLAAQREANNGDSKEGEHSPKRMNTRQRSKSTERDLVAVVEVEKRTGRLRRSSRGDKSGSEIIDKHDGDKNGTNNNLCLESIAELNECSVKEDGQLFNEMSDLPSSALSASVDNPADIPMPDVANVPLPEPKSSSVIQIVSEIPVAISDNPLPPPDVQSTESTVDQLEKENESDANKTVEVAATCDSATDKKDGKTSTSFRSKRSSTEETTSHSKRRGRSRSRSASSSSDRSSSKRKSSRKSRHSSSRRRSPSSGRNHRKSSRYSKRSSHKTDGRSRSRSVENASSTKKRDERKDEKEKEMKKNKDDKKFKEERVDKELEDCKSKASKESVETLDKPEFQDTSMKMSKEDITDESADKNDKDKTNSSGDKDSRREANKRDRSLDKDSRRPSSRRDSSKNKDIVLSEESSCKEGASNPRETKTSEVPKSSKVSPDTKNVERSLNEEKETEKEENTDDPATEADAVKHEPDVIFKSARKVSLLRPKSISEEEQGKPKRRKWGSSATAKSSLEISSNSLKSLIPDVKPLSPSEVTLKYSSESSEEEHEAEVEINLKDADHNELLDDLMSDSEEKYLGKTVEIKKDEDISKVEVDKQPEISPNKRKRSVSTDARKKEKHDRREEKRESRRDRVVKEISPRRHKKHLPEKTVRRPLNARNVSVVEAGPYSYKPSIAPPQNPVSRVIIINNLTRPFTVKAITDLLLRTGRLAENGFWMDRIKSTCLAMFETIDQAEETRSALHGVKWPADNNKNLFVDFATENDLKEKLSDKDNSLPTYSAEEPRRDRRKLEGPIREWDLIKVGERSPGEREREKERQRREREEERERDKRRREQSPKEERKLKKPPPVRSVDDLFKKTKARPFIYWLPLTPEQIVEKEALRRKKMAESERMLAEIKEQERLRQKKREKERELREKEREQREKEREQREKERNSKRSKSISRRRSRSRSPKKSPRRSPRRTRRSASRDSRKSHRRSRSRSRS